MDPGLGGPERDAERVGDLGDRESQVEVEDHGRSLVWLQAPEASVELVVVIDRAGPVFGRRLDPDHPDLRDLPLPVPTLVGAGIDDEPIQPRVPTLWVTQRREVTPGMHESILDGILCEVRVPKDEAGDGEESVAGRDREDLEGLVVAPLCRLDEIALHGSFRPLGPFRPARHYMTAGQTRTVQEWRRRARCLAEPDHGATRPGPVGGCRRLQGQGTIGA